MCELLLAHNEKKVDYLAGQLRSLQNENSTLLRQSDHVINVYNENMLHDEMTDERMPQFAAYADNIYYNAWVHHCSGFQPNTPLLDDTQLSDVYKVIERNFPWHFRSLKSIMFGKRSNEPKRASTNYNQEKRHVLVHYFFCLIRERDRHHLLHWAMVATIALHYRGADSVSFRNHLGRAATVEVRVAIDKLDSIFEERAESRINVLSSQQYLTNVLDNYNRFQKFSTQRCGSSGVFHNGIVYSAIRVHECNKPLGTIMMNQSEERGKVVSSTLSPTFEYCTVVLESLAKDEDGNQCTATGNTRTVRFPTLEWKIIHMPGENESVPITYNNQAIPIALRMSVPAELSNQDLIMGDRSWMAEKKSSHIHRSLGVREYVSLVRQSRQLVDILAHFQDSMRKDCNVVDQRVLDQREDIDHKKCMSFQQSINDCIVTNHPHLCHHIRQHQKHFLEYFNESYHAVSKYMWMTLSAKDEMQKDELFLALIEILGQLGFVDNSDGLGTVLEGYQSRRIFQYGDVLTIQKLHQLNPGVLKRMTHIGKDDSVRQLYALFTNTTL
jgi:hypothetical protein